MFRLASEEDVTSGQRRRGIRPTPRKKRMLQIRFPAGSSAWQVRGIILLL